MRAVYSVHVMTWRHSGRRASLAHGIGCWITRAAVEAGPALGMLPQTTSGTAMSRAFAYCSKIVLGLEGGEVNDPVDPGQHTNLGITQTTLNRARLRLPALPLSVVDLNERQALDIYELLYWRPIRGDELPLPLALLAFDCAVNQGELDAKRYLQLSLGVTPDGILGEQTLAAARKAGTPQLVELAARRMNDYMGLRDELRERFGLGWSRRLCHVLAEALDADGMAL